MAIKIFGWELRKCRPADDFTAADRLASFILMAMTEKVNRLFSPHGFTVQVSQAERTSYTVDGKVPYRIALAASEFRQRFMQHMHRLLLDEGQPSSTLSQLTARPSQGPAADVALLSRLLACTEGWERSPQGIPFFCLFDYLPLHMAGDDRADDAAVRFRHMVWHFKYDMDRTSPRKHVDALYDAVMPLAALLNAAFDTLAEHLTLFCIPASNEESQWMRYREFSQLLCRLTGMADSFRHVHIRTDKVPAHLGGDKRVNYRLDEGWFRDRAVVVFDDVLTTGGSLARCTDRLREAGAVVVAACFLGHTVKKE